MWDDAGDGFTGKVKAHGSDIIEKAGWKTGNKYVDFTTGLLADIGLDPTTYVGAGLAKQAGNSAVNLANPRGLAKRGALAITSNIRTFLV